MITLLTKISGWGHRAKIPAFCFYIKPIEGVLFRGLAARIISILITLLTSEEMLIRETIRFYRHTDFKNDKVI